MAGERGAEQFSAKDSAVGYLYQVRLALLWALRKVGTSSDFSVALETLDDVVFDENGRPLELLQAKHHISRVSALSDACPDIWKTFRVWLTGLKFGQVSPQTALLLVTTGTCPENSAAFLLRDNATRNEVLALELLRSTASSSQSKINREAYDLFRVLSEPEQLEFLRKVVVVDQTVNAADMADALLYELRLMVWRDFAVPALEVLEGWWFTQIVRQLTSRGIATPIPVRAIELKIDDIREQFRHDSLPIDEELQNLRLDQVALEAYSQYRFVKQVQLVTGQIPRHKRAITDYFRSFTQRSRWLRKDIMLTSHEQQFRNELLDDWEVRFAQMHDDLLTKTATEEELTRAGSDMLRWVESEVMHAFRPGVDAPWIARGLLHEMANNEQVGWHPEYLQRLAPSTGHSQEEDI